MRPYDAPAGEVWETDMGTLVFLLEGYVPRGTEMYRRALNLTDGGMIPFGKDSWMDEFAVKLA